MTTGARRAMSEQEPEQPEAELSPSPGEQFQRHRGRRRHHNRPRHLEPSINMDELRELVGLITSNGMTDFELEREVFHVKIGRNMFPAGGMMSGEISERKAFSSGAYTHTDVSVCSVI